MQFKGKQYKNLLIETKKVWDKIPGNALEDFYNAINNSNKYSKQEKELAKQILLS